MSLLIINTLQENDEAVNTVIKELTHKIDSFKIINTHSMNISHCVGCYVCVLQTPGVCSLKDDYIRILLEILHHETIIYISNTSMGFVNSETKKIVDRMLPLNTFLNEYRNGEIRHITRYKKNFKFGLIYNGSADNEYMNLWLERLSINYNSFSIGAFPVCKVKELKKCIL